MSVSQCPIYLPNGTRCTNIPHDGSLLDICPKHWAEVVEDHKRNTAGPDHLLVTVICPVCRYELRTGPGQHVECSNPTCWDDRWWEQPNPNAEVPTRQGTDWIYYIRFGDRVKIGTSSNVKARLSTLPYDALLALEPGGVDLERRRHAEFAVHRVPGQREWFEDTLALRDHVETLRRAHGDPHDLMRRPQ